MLSLSAVEASFWSYDHWRLTDSLNATIWRLSPIWTWKLHGKRMLDTPGEVGAEQAMVPERRCPLPWVPDLVGMESDQRRGVLVVGSAYAPFIADLAQRKAKLTLSAYEAAMNSNRWSDFQRAFLTEVVQKDSDYYPQIPRIFGAMVLPSESIILDLCRASFCRLGSRPTYLSEHSFLDQGGDEVAVCNPGLFRSYTESRLPNRWVWSRFRDSQATVIIALGYLAEHGLLRLFWRDRSRIIHRRLDTNRSRPWAYRSVEGWPRKSPGYADPEFKSTWWAANRDWWVVTDLKHRCVWKILPLPHPKYRPQSRRDEAYERAPEIIQLMRDDTQ